MRFRFWLSHPLKISIIGKQDRNPRAKIKLSHIKNKFYWTSLEHLVHMSLEEITVVKIIKKKKNINKRWDDDEDLQVKEQNDWAVIGSKDFGANDVCFDMLHKTFRDNKVIQSPSDILCSCTIQVAPERVSTSFLGMEVSVSISESKWEQLGEAFALFWRKAGILLVWAWIG